MAYAAATAIIFKARFPAFVDVPDPAIEAALTEARRMVDGSWIEDDRQTAEMLLAAHTLTMDGMGATREAQLQGFKRLKLGSLELERDSGSSSSTSAYASTTYGQRFRTLLKRSHPGVIAIGGDC